VIVSLSSVFVNGLEQRRSAAFGGRSSKIFLLTENPTEVKAPGTEISIERGN
jgi:hypothetical protein